MLVVSGAALRDKLGGRFLERFAVVSGLIF